jgi:hypothetical protein
VSGTPSLPPRPASIAAALFLLAAASVSGQSPWNPTPAEAHRTGTFRNRDLQESSGVAVSRRTPGLLWTFNDSGNAPWLFATDTLGTDRGTFEVTGARNEDWEAMALAPCDSSACIYLADTGDNLERRSSVRLYRLPEPAVADGAGRRRHPTAKAQALELRFPDGPRDVEAMFVDAQATIYLISKGFLSPVRLYRVPATAWKRGRVAADSLGSLPIDSGAGLGSLVTDAALAPNGREVVVRTYQDIYFFDLGQNGRLRPAPDGATCSVAGLEIQGEGVAWLDDSTLVLTSERGYGAVGTVSVARCRRHE